MEEKSKKYLSDLEKEKGIVILLACETDARIQEEMELAFKNSKLPDEPDLDMINNLTYRLRARFYKDNE
jgi:hypothetical protein